MKACRWVPGQLRNMNMGQVARIGMEGGDRIVSFEI
jgi:hypothetical protein